jgi:hypothetical protein
VTGYGHFGKSEVEHAYGNKRFHLHDVQVVRSASESERCVAIELRSTRRGVGAAPVRLTLTPEDAALLGRALMGSEPCQS